MSLQDELGKLSYKNLRDAHIYKKLLNTKCVGLQKSLSKHFTKYMSSIEKNAANSLKSLMQRRDRLQRDLRISQNGYITNAKYKALCDEI